MALSLQPTPLTVLNSLCIQQAWQGFWCQMSRSSFVEHCAMLVAHWWLICRTHITSTLSWVNKLTPRGHSIPCNKSVGMQSCTLKALKGWVGNTSPRPVHQFLGLSSQVASLRLGSAKANCLTWHKGAEFWGISRGQTWSLNYNSGKALLCVLYQVTSDLELQ